MSYYIPQSYNDFDAWFHHLTDYVVAKTSGTPPEWTHIPPVAVTSLINSVDYWDAAHQAALADPTPAKNEEHKRVLHVSVKFSSIFINQYMRFPPVTNEDRTNNGIPNADTTPTQVPEPTSRPILSNLRAVGGFVITFHFYDEFVESSQAVPTGYAGCQTHFAVGPEKITDLKLLKETKLFTASPARMSFSSDDEGKWLSISPQWQLQRDGILGPPGPIEYVRIV
jgi:hypothetical protein